MVEELRAQVAQACRVIGGLGLTKAATGHISARVPGTDTILIRARGPDEIGVRYTEPQDVITVDFNGKKLAGRDGLEPPQEVFIHTWMYRKRPELASVVHAHPATVVLFTICNKPLLPLYGAYDPSSLKLLMEGIPTYPRSITVSNDKLGEEFANSMPGRACLMRGPRDHDRWILRPGSHAHRDQAERAGRDELSRAAVGESAADSRR